MQNDRDFRLFVTVHRSVHPPPKVVDNSPAFDTPHEPYAPPTTTMFLLHGVAGSSKVVINKYIKFFFTNSLIIIIFINLYTY